MPGCCFNAKAKARNQLKEKFHEFRRRKTQLRNTRADAPIMAVKTRRLVTDINSLILQLRQQDCEQRIKPFLALIDEINGEFVKNAA